MMQAIANILPDQISSLLVDKPAQPEPQWNSQGERLEAPEQSAPVSTSQLQQQPQKQPQQTQLLESSYEDVSLWDTPLAEPLDALHPPTDDSGLVHAIISWGHVLKSTHDLARWSEKTGARRVNGQESIDAISDLIVGLEAPREVAGGSNNASSGKNNRARNRGAKQSTQPSQVISCGPVLKSTHDAATWSEKRGANAVNSAAAAGLLDDVAVNTQGASNQSGNQGANNQKQGRQRGPRRANAPKQPSQGPVLKSTHDAATWSEKRTANAVNPAGAEGLFDDLAVNAQGGQSAGVQAGGSSLQSGLDTQGGSHIQLDGSKVKSD